MGKLSELYSQMAEQNAEAESQYIRTTTPGLQMQSAQPKPQAEEKNEQPGLMSDVASLWGVGSGQLVKGAGWLFGSDSMEDVGQDTVDYWQAELSDAQREANQKPFVEDDYTPGEGLTDARTWMGTIVQSLPMMTPGVGAAGLVGRGAMALGAGKGAATAAAATAGSATEGATIGAMVGEEVESTIMDAPLEELQNSPYFQDLIEAGKGEDEARQLVAGKASEGAGLQAGVLGAILGVGFNKFVGDAVTGRLSERLLKETGKGVGEGAGTELAQTGVEAYSRQTALNEELGRPYDVPGAVNEMVGGTGAGGVMGGAVGFSGGLAGSDVPAPQAEPTATEEAPQPEPTIQPQPAEPTGPAEPAFDDPLDDIGQRVTEAESAPVSIRARSSARRAEDVSGFEGQTENVTPELNADTAAKGKSAPTEQAEPAIMDSASVLPEPDQDVVNRRFSEPEARDTAVHVFDRVRPSTSNQRELAAIDVEINGDQGEIAGPRVQVLDGLRQALNANKPLRSQLQSAFPEAEQGDRIPGVTATSSRSMNLIANAIRQPEINDAVNRSAQRIGQGESRADVMRDLRGEISDFEVEAQREGLLDPEDGVNSYSINGNDSRPKEGQRGRESRDDEYPDVPEVERNAQSVPDETVVSPRERMPGMGSELSGLPEGYGGAADAAAYTGQNQQRRELRAGERPVGADENAAKQQTQQSGDRISGPEVDDQSMGRENRDTSNSPEQADRSGNELRRIVNGPLGQEGEAFSPPREDEVDSADRERYGVLRDESVEESPSGSQGGRLEAKDQDVPVQRGGNVAVGNSATEQPDPRMSSRTDISTGEISATSINEYVTRETDTAPSEAQARQGNYKKARIKLSGLDIAIENPKGSTRSGTDPDGKRWESTMAHHYGDIKGTTAADGDNLDVFIGPYPEIDQVFVIDQQNADGSFDEAKVMLGFANEAEAREGYLANYEDGWKVGPITRMSMDDFKAWMRDGDTTKPVAESKPAQQPEPADAAPSQEAEAESGQADQEAEQPAQPIADFGQKIEGARKDYASKLSAAKDQDVAAVPLSKSWPEPNYQKMLDGGTPPETVALVRALRDEVPTKPQKGWKLKGWAEMVSGLRDMASALMENQDRAGKVIDQIKAMKSSNRSAREAKNILGRMDLYQEMGHDDSFKGVTLNDSFYQIYMGETNVTVWEVERQSKATAFGNMPRTLATGKTREEALANLRKALDKLPESTKEGRAVRFNIYRDRYSNDVFIGKKIGKDVVRMQTFDNDMKAARKYLEENQQALEEQLERMKRIPAHRRQSNSPRVGVDHRKGGDVTAEAFAETFGFRGVQFGNYVEQGRRQQDLNEAYDGLMDLAGILDIPAKAISLNGELGLAFGARGKGGKNSFAAHYEPGQIVINLTKKSGAGSLAHEWWHSLDNYFGRGTDRKPKDAFASGGKPASDVRPEMVDAFRNIRQTVNRIRMKERSQALDKMRSKAYWATDIEMSARAFESYVIERLQDQGASNDYLANIVSEDYWKAQEAMGMQDGDSYPYPEAAEIPEVRAAYDHFFQTIETREGDDGNIMLYSRGGQTPRKPLPKNQVRRTVDNFFRRYKGADDVSIEYHDTAETLPGYSAERDAGATIAGQYDSRTDTIHLVVSAYDSQSAVREALQEEILVHKGLGFFRPEDRQQLYRDIQQAAQESPEVASLWDQTVQDYRDVAESANLNEEQANRYYAEELLGSLAQKKINWLQRGWRTLRRGIKRLLVKAGWVRDNIGVDELRGRIDLIAKAFEHGRRAPRRDFARDVAGEGAATSEDLPAFSRMGNKLDAAATHFNDLTDDQRAALGKIAPRTPKEKARDWLKERTDRWQTKVRQGAIDRFAALADVDMAVHGRDVIENSTASSSWVLSQMSGAASGALQSMLTTSRIKLNQREKVITLQDGTRGLNDTLKDLGSAAEIERFFGWIAGNRSQRLMREGRENLFEPAEVEALAQLNRGTTDSGQNRIGVYASVFREFRQYRDDVLGIAEESGIITPEQRKTWANEFYVPFYRLAEDDSGFTGPKATGGISRQEAYKKLKGGSQNLNDLLENTMMNFHHLLQASLKNQAAMQAMDNSQEMGIAREVREADRDTENSTFVLRDGQKIWYEIDDPLVFKAVTALAHPGMNSSAMKILRSFKRLFTNLTTTTPQFVVANLLRDSMQAAATSEVSKNVLGNMVQGSKAYGDPKIRAKMMASGGSFSFGHLYGENADELRLRITGGLAQADILRSPSMVPDAIRGMWRKWNDMTEFTENINRAAIYQQNVQERGDLYAAFKSRDLMNFSQHGAWPAMRVLIDVVPFMNARLQGLDKIYRSGVKPGLRTAMGQGTANEKQAAMRFWSVTGTIALATIALYLNNRDDEEYKKLEDWQKDTYWFFRISEDHAIFIPKPFEVGAIATLAERLTEQAVDDSATGELFADRLSHMLLDTFSFSPVPQAFQPALDIYSNYDAFTGRPIEGMGMERLSPSLRRRSNTTALATGMSSGLESVFGSEGRMTLSPVQIDHAIQGYFGSVGSWVAGVADTIWRTAGGETEPSTFWYENQPIRRFYKNLGDEDRYTRYGTVFYEALRETNRVYADIKEYAELGEVEKAREMYRQNRQKMAYRIILNRVQRKLSEVNNAMQKVRRLEASPEYKRRELDRLRALKNRMQEAVGKKVQDLNASS